MCVGVGVSVVEEAGNLLMATSSGSGHYFRDCFAHLVWISSPRLFHKHSRQTIGFNWGPSGVSTSVWKGVLLRDLLLEAGVNERDMVGKHVEFIGVEDLPNKVGPGPFKDEPWGKLGKYGTSVPLARAMNPAYDIIIAYEQNGERLQPDHGYPVRLIIPGYIGGRMIKWLKEINIIPYETKNHYHYVSYQQPVLSRPGPVRCRQTNAQQFSN